MKIPVLVSKLSIILAITAISVLLYTHQTSIIAKESQHRIESFERPVVGFDLYTNPDCFLDTRVKVTNLSNYPIAVRINIKFKINEELIKDVNPPYEGKEYWNLQYKESKKGHFIWLDWLVKKGLISNSQKQLILNKKEDELSELKKILKQSLPKLSLDIDIYCENEKGYSSYYPPVHYDYHYNKFKWVPTLSSDKPFWKYPKKPDWIKNNI